MSKVQVGHLVHYHTSEDDKKAMREQQCNVQDVLPAVVVAKWSDTCLNLRIIMDGPGTVPGLWRTSVLLKSAEVQPYSWEPIPSGSLVVPAT